MAGNTGFKQFANLELYYPDDNSVAGETKPNVYGTIGYIAPFYDETCTPSERFYNQVRTLSGTKDDCTSGQTGVSLTMTVEANMFISTVSLADANTIADNYLLSNIQAYANNIGSCTSSVVCLCYVVYWISPNNFPEVQQGVGFTTFRYNECNGSNNTVTVYDMQSQNICAQVGSIYYFSGDETSGFEISNDNCCITLPSAVNDAYNIVLVDLDPIDLFPMVNDGLGTTPTIITAINSSITTGTITITGFGSQLTFTPNGTSANETFTYTITDNLGNTSTATITLNISSTITPPTNSNWVYYQSSLDPSDPNFSDDGTLFNFEVLTSLNNTDCPISYIPDTVFSPIQATSIKMKVYGDGLEPFDSRAIYKTFEYPITITNPIRQSIHLEDLNPSIDYLVDGQFRGFIRFADNLNSSYFQIEVGLSVTDPIPNNCSGNTYTNLWPTLNKINISISELTTLRNEAITSGIYPYSKTVVSNGVNHYLTYNGTATLSTITKVMIGMKSDESHMDLDGIMWFNDPGLLYNINTGQDTQAPSLLGSLLTDLQSDSSFRAYWTVATDNVGVAGYYIKLDGQLYDSVASNILEYNFYGLLANSLYTVSVAAFDAAGNIGQYRDANATTTNNGLAPN